MAYPYEQIFAADPSDASRVATNGVVTIFAPGDTAQTPLTITTLTGLPLSNPIQVNDAGYGPAFMHATLDQVAWAGGGLSGLFASYKGMKDEAVAARVAAEAAVTEVQSPTDQSVDRGILRADIPGKVAQQIADGPIMAGVVAGYAKAPGNPVNEALNAAIVSTAGHKSSIVLNADEYAIYPNDTTQDSTAGLQAAINTVEALGIGTLQMPGMNLLVNGTIRIKKPIHLDFNYGATPTTQPYRRQGGASIVTNGGKAGTFVFDIAPEGLGLGEGGQVVSPEEGGARILGVKLDGLYLFGGADGAGVDRGGIRMAAVHTEIALQDVKIINFKRQGILCAGVYDGTMRGVTLISCGSATYPALDLQNNSNALHIFGIHIESCEFPLRLGGSTRHVQFVAGKIEMYSYGPLRSPIQILDTFENSFDSMQFVQHNADDAYFYPSGSDQQPAFILLEGTSAKSRTIFNSCMFTTAPYHQGGALPTQGSRWFKNLGGYLQVNGGVIDTCWGGSGDKSLRLGDQAMLNGVHLRSRGKGGIRNLMEIGSDCIIDACMIDASDPLTAMTGGALITATGEGNTWGPSNKIRCTVGSYIQASGMQSFHEMERTAVAVASGTPTPNLGWVNRGNSRLFSIFQAGAAATWTGHVADKRFSSDEITIIFINGLTTIEDGTAWKLRGAVNATPPAGAYMHFRYNGTAFVELWRNF